MMDERAAIVAYLHLIAWRCGSYGLPERHGEQAVRERQEFLHSLADDIEAGEHVKADA